MARRARKHLPDGIVHAYSRGIRHERLFLVEDDAHEFLDRATDAFARFEVLCWSYCLMPTHYHFGVRARCSDISAAMHRLNGGYARWFNRRYGYRGHLFGGRFGTRAVVDEHHLLEVARYIVLNPVRAGLCAHPREWRWSSYGATAGEKLPLPLLDLSWMRGVITPAGFVAHVAEAPVPATLAA